MTDSLPTDFTVAATIRLAANEGVPITVVRHGYDSSGAIVLKINLLNGTARVLERVRYDEALVWMPVSAADPMAEVEADRYLEKQAQIDPDCWIVEVEDRRGRHWFDGKVMAR